MHCMDVHKTKVTRPRPRRYIGKTETRPRRSTFKTETRRGCLEPETTPLAVSSYDFSPFLFTDSLIVFIHHAHIALALVYYANVSVTKVSEALCFPVVCPSVRLSVVRR